MVQTKVGIITRAAGIKGDIWLKSLILPPENITRLMPLSDETGTRQFDFILRYSKKSLLRCGEQTIIDRNQAEALAGTFLYADADKLLEAEEQNDADSNYQGFSVTRADGTMAGTVHKIVNYGASDILQCVTADATGNMEYMIPLIDDFIASVNKDDKSIHLQPTSDIFFEL
ncbi:MAG: hypothetical protein K0U45_01900 [Alphaproteobacteria bacterium]|nr:hypothetical protein [Alphaproteobacteria bacterium]